MQQFTINLGAHSVCVHRWGEGPHLLVAWHGFRQNGQAFAKMATFLPEGYTLCAPDLPFHGKTNWRAADYTPDDLWEIVVNLPGYSQGQKVALAGFSLGGYLAGGMAIARPDATARLWLLAPDTRLTSWGGLTHGMPYAWRWRLQRWLDKPGRLLPWADRLYRMGLIDRFALAFLHRTLSDRSRRQQLFGTWRARALFPFSFPGLQQTGIAIKVVLGEDDPLIPAAKLRKRMQAFAGVVVVACGHELLPRADLWVEQIS